MTQCRGPGNAGRTVRPPSAARGRPHAASVSNSMRGWSVVPTLLAVRVAGECYGVHMSGTLSHIVGQGAEPATWLPAWDGALYAANTDHHRRFDARFLATLP